MLPLSNNFQEKKINNIPQSGSIPQRKQMSRNIINRIIHLKDDNGNPLAEKYNIESILSNIQKHQIEIVDLFSKYLKEGFNLLEFIRFFLNIIPHSIIENLYLAMGLIDLFREITLQTHKQKIVLKDITDYMCDKILRNNNSFNKIEAKFIPFTKFVRPNLQNKIFLQMPPIIYGEDDEQTHKLYQKSIKTDSSKHSRAIIRSQFCYDLKKVFILDALTQSISVYDQNCILQKKISPVLTKLKKEVIILSFAFSKRQYRIGAVLKDFSLKFWDHFNNFQYQKSISTTSLCQNLQTNIYFLQYFNTWTTTDKTGTLYYWNLLEQKPDRQMKCKYNAAINDICEISSLNLILVVQQCRRASKLITQCPKNQPSIMDATVVIYNFFKGHIITEIDLLGQRIPHTVLYSESYQVLFMSGLEKKIKIYELHPKFMDASLKGQLIGHQNLITSFTLINETPMIASADDKGKVKLWDFRTFTCLQTIDFSDKTLITNLLDMIQIGKIGVFGSRVNYIEFQDKYDIIKRRNQVETIKVQWIDSDQNLKEMYLFANKTLRVINLQNGQIKHIFSFKQNNCDDQITVFRYFSCLKKFVLGNTKGEILIYNHKTGQMQEILKQIHQGALSMIEFDQLNKIYITIGYDSKILIHRASDGTILREIKNNFNGKQINCMDVSVYHNILVVGSNSNNCIYCWNYEFGKLIGQIKLKNQMPVSLQFINGFNLLVVATSEGRIYVLRTTLVNSDLEIQLVDQINIGKTIVSVYVNMKLKGKSKATNCQSCKITICCQNGIIIEYDLLDFMKSQVFKQHCKEKSNYNPYRQGKENFLSELQKIKHTFFDINTQQTNQKYSIFKNYQELCTQFNSISLCKLIKLEQNYNLTIGNQRRIKIWSQSHELLCDYNINYCLPYKWNLTPNSTSLITEKIYFGIKIMENIVKKYENDISIGEAKNLQIRELFNYIQKNQSDKYQQRRMKMITEPDQKITDEKQNLNIKLLQNQYSRKDLNFDLVKRYNFTQIGGPTLKQLDNIKKMQILQKQWKIKEQKQHVQKEQLLKNIENKAKKLQEKDHIQFVLVKHKKYSQPDLRIENQKIHSLAKKLNAIENKNVFVDDKKLLTAFSKNFYRLSPKIDLDFKNNSITDQSFLNRLSNSKPKKSFEEYYVSKKNVELNVSGQDNKQKCYRFRDILTEMNGRVKNVKKHRYRQAENREIKQSQ